MKIISANKRKIICKKTFENLKNMGGQKQNEFRINNIYYRGVRSF